MNKLMLSIVLFSVLLFSTHGGLVISGDNDLGFNMFQNDKLLYSFTQIHPDLTSGLNFTTVSIPAQDQEHGTALTSTGDLYSWHGTYQVFSLIEKRASSVVAISSSVSHVLYVTSDKKVYCFGDNSKRACGLIASCTKASPCLYGNIASLNATNIEAADKFSFVLSDAGEIYASGDNSDPQEHLGVNSTESTVGSPLKVFGSVTGKTIVKVKSSTIHHAALDSDNVLHAWGSNSNGEVGDGTTVLKTSSVICNITALNGETIVDFALPTRATIIITSTGKIFAAGDFRNVVFAGQYGVNQLIPVFVAHNNYIQGKVVKVSTVQTSKKIVSFLTSAGDIYVCGETVFNGSVQFAQHLPFDKKFIGMTGDLIAIGEDGKLYGIGDNRKNFIVPTFANERMTGTKFDDISVLPKMVDSSDSDEQKTFFAISKNNVLYGQGNTAGGKLGLNPNSLVLSHRNSYPFSPINSNTNFNNTGITKAAPSSKHLALLKGTILYTTGEFTGNNKTSNEVVEVNLASMAGKTIKNIYPSSTTTVILTMDNNVYYFGDDIFDGGLTTTQGIKKMNTSVLGSETIKDIQCGNRFCLFHTNEGNVFGSGENTRGQLGNNVKIDSFSEVVKTDMSLVTAPIAEFSVGNAHVIYRTTDSLVFGAGSNAERALGFKSTISGDKTKPTQLINVTDSDYLITRNVTARKIAAGGQISIILTTSGSFLVFGKYASYYRNSVYEIASLTNTPSFIYPPIYENETVVDISVRYRTIYFLTDFTCQGILSSNSSVCSGFGQCASYDNCKCNAGYIGVTCELSVCAGKNSSDPNVCSAHGTCIAPNNCSCTDGYTGDTCQFPICYQKNASDSSVCSGKGSCIAPNNCSCLTGYEGNQCELFKCNGKNFSDPNVCSGNGMCLTPNNCTCQNGYIGNDCQLVTCSGKNTSDPTICSGKGSCVAPNNCSCSTGYSGNQCELFQCNGKNFSDPNVCSGKGTCLTPNNCTCQNGYIGSDCQLVTCFGKNSSDPTICSRKGSCVVPNNCSCSVGYSGNQCELFQCNGKNFSDPNVCSGKGTCLTPNNCTCQNGYIGSDCQSISCFGKSFSDPTVCSGKGNCSSVNNCTCENGYSGNQCEIQPFVSPVASPMTPMPSNAPMTSNGFPMNSPNPITSNGAPSTSPNPMTSNGAPMNSPNPSTSSGTPSTSPNPSKSPTVIRSCFGKLSNDSTVCSGRGKCNSPDVCTCETGFNGNQCQNTNTTSDSSRLLYSFTLLLSILIFYLF
eukprot:gene7655-11975_t